MAPEALVRLRGLEFFATLAGELQPALQRLSVLLARTRRGAAAGARPGARGPYPAGGE